MRTSQVSSTEYNRPMRLALIVGLVAAIIGVIGAFVSGPGLFFQAYLYSYLFWAGIGFGLLALLLLHLLTGSRWGLTIRRVAEAGAGSIWVSAILFIPLLLGIPYLYSWADPETIPSTEVLAFKDAYLSVPFFAIRAVIYFIVWSLLAFVVNRNISRLSTTPDGAEATRSRLQGLGAGGLILFVLTMTFASIDWLMSLQPFWSSTIFGLIIIVGQVLTAMAFAVLMINRFPSLTQGRRWAQPETPIPYRDLGALMLTFVMGWAYLAYFQFLIMWAANLPREAAWYLARSEGGWSILIILIFILQFVLPFSILLSMKARHNLRILAGLGALLLVTYLVNMFWHVKPVFSPGVFSISWLDIVMPIALGGIWLAAFFYNLSRRPAFTQDEAASLSLPEAKRRTERPVRP